MQLASYQRNGRMMIAAKCVICAIGLAVLLPAEVTIAKRVRRGARLRARFASVTGPLEGHCASGNGIFSETRTSGSQNAV